MKKTTINKNICQLRVVCGQKHHAVASAEIHVAVENFKLDSDTIQGTGFPTVTFPFFTPNYDSG